MEPLPIFDLSLFVVYRIRPGPIFFKAGLYLILVQNFSHWFRFAIYPLVFFSGFFLGGESTTTNTILMVNLPTISSQVCKNVLLFSTFLSRLPNTVEHLPPPMGGFYFVSLTTLAETFGTINLFNVKH